MIHTRLFVVVPLLVLLASSFLIDTVFAGDCTNICELYCFGSAPNSALAIAECCSNGYTSNEACKSSNHGTTSCYCECTNGFKIGKPSYGGCGDCFSSYTTAEVHGVGKVSMKDLKVGDEVLTGNGNYETIYSIDHRHNTKRTTFLQIHHSTSSDSEPLELTGKHMLFVEGKLNPIPAKDVRVGDYVQSITGPREVTKVSSIVREGLYNPLTSHGTIVVNDVIASTYSAFFSKNEWIEVAGVRLMTHQTFFTKALKPYNYFCTGLSSLELCKLPSHDDSSNNNEKVAISELAAQFYGYWNNQNAVIQSVTLAVVLTLVCIVDLLLLLTNKTVFFLAFVVAGGCGLMIVKKSKKNNNNKTKLC